METELRESQSQKQKSRNELREDGKFGEKLTISIENQNYFMDIITEEDYDDGDNT